MVVKPYLPAVSTTPPGWYPRPDHPGLLGYWNGAEWTDDLKPAEPTDKKRLKRHRAAQAAWMRTPAYREYFEQQQREAQQQAHYAASVESARAHRAYTDWLERSQAAATPQITECRYCRTKLEVGARCHHCGARHRT